MKKAYLFIGLLMAFGARADFLPASFSAKFSQEYMSSLKGKVKKGNGAISYKYPSNIRFETTNPTHVLYISNGDKAWYYSFPFVEGEKGELTESNAKDGKGLFTKFFDSLKNGLKSNNLYDVTKLSNAQLINFKSEASKTVGMRSAKLFFNGDKTEFSSLQKIEIEFNDNKKSTMNLSEIKINPNFESGEFSFNLPVEKKSVQKN